MLPVMEVAPHILLIDDDRETRDLLAQFLQKHGLRGGKSDQIKTSPFGSAAGGNRND